MDVYTLEEIKTLYYIMKTDNLILLSLFEPFFGIQLSAENNFALILAATNGNLDIVKYLIHLPGTQAGIDEAIAKAKEFQHFEIVSYLESYKQRGFKEEPYTDEELIHDLRHGSLSIFDAIDAKDPDLVIRILSTKTTTKDENKEVLSWAAHYGYTDVIDFLQPYGYGEPEEYVYADDDDETTEIVKSGNFDLARQIMFAGLTSRKENNEILSWAAYYGDIDTIKFLIESNKVDPSSLHNLALITAAKHGYLDIVEYLLSFPGVVNGIDKAISAAEISGHVEMAQMLIQYRNRIKKFQ